MSQYGAAAQKKEIRKMETCYITTNSQPQEFAMKMLSKVHRIWSVLTEEERAEERDNFESEYPELAAHIKTQVAKKEPLDLALMEKFNPHPEWFFTYLLAVLNALGLTMEIAGEGSLNARPLFSCGNNNQLEWN
jgi:hypothetical protein